MHSLFLNEQTGRMLSDIASYLLCFVREFSSVLYFMRVLNEFVYRVDSVLFRAGVREFVPLQTAGGHELLLAFRTIIGLLSRVSTFMYS